MNKNEATDLSSKEKKAFKAAIEAEVDAGEAELEGYGQELAHFRSPEDSARLSKLIEEGRQEIARLMREWEETAKQVEEQEAERAE